MSVRHTISAGAATSTRADTSRAPGISGSARTSTTTSRESGASTRSACPLASTDRVLPIAAGDALSCAAHCAAYARSLLRARPGSGDAAARQRRNNSAVRACAVQRCCAHPAVSMSPHSFASSAVRYASDTTRSRACGETRARRLASANTRRCAEPYRARVRTHLLLLPARLRQLHLLQLAVCGGPRLRRHCERSLHERCLLGRLCSSPELPPRHAFATEARAKKAQRVRREASSAAASGARSPAGRFGSGSRHAYTVSSSFCRGASGKAQAKTLSSPAAA